MRPIHSDFSSSACRPQEDFVNCAQVPLRAKKAQGVCQVIERQGGSDVKRLTLAAAIAASMAQMTAYALTEVSGDYTITSTTFSVPLVFTGDGRHAEPRERAGRHEARGIRGAADVRGRRRHLERPDLVGAGGRRREPHQADVAERRSLRAQRRHDRYFPLER